MMNRDPYTGTQLRAARQLDRHVPLTLPRDSFWQRFIKWFIWNFTGRN